MNLLNDQMNHWSMSSDSFDHLIYDQMNHCSYYSIITKLLFLYIIYMRKRRQNTARPSNNHIGDVERNRSTPNKQSN